MGRGQGRRRSRRATILVAGVFATALVSYMAERATLPWRTVSMVDFVPEHEIRRTSPQELLYQRKDFADLHRPASFSVSTRSLLRSDCAELRLDLIRCARSRRLVR